MSDEPRPDPPKPDPPSKPDPSVDAEHRLRQMLAAESRQQREHLGMVQKGFYGCIGLVILLFLILLFFS